MLCTLGDGCSVHHGGWCVVHPRRWVCCAPWKMGTLCIPGDGCAVHPGRWVCCAPREMVCCILWEMGMLCACGDGHTVHPKRWVKCAPWEMGLLCACGDGYAVHLRRWVRCAPRKMGTLCTPGDGFAVHLGRWVCCQRDTLTFLAVDRCREQVTLNLLVLLKGTLDLCPCHELMDLSGNFPKFLRRQKHQQDILYVTWINVKPALRAREMAPTSVSCLCYQSQQEEDDSASAGLADTSAACTASEVAKIPEATLPCPLQKQSGCSRTYASPAWGLRRLPL